MKKLGIYIHIPYCKSKCTYCNFYSVAAKNILASKNIVASKGIMVSKDFPNEKNRVYSKEVDSTCNAFSEILEHHILVDNIIKEIFLFAKSKNFTENKSKYKISSIYFGGGTPSFIEPTLIKSIIDAIKTAFKINNDLFRKLEVTIETNPDSITKSKLDLYYKYGFNRLSVGLQAYDDRLLALMGRPYNCNIFDKCVEVIKASQFKNWGLDLIFGLPTQTIKEWGSTLKKVIFYEPKHVSCYSLEIHTNTPLGKMINQHKLPQPDEDIDRQMYHKAISVLSKSGYLQYEISNFCKKGYECKHNLDFWNGGSYIGFGPSACSLFEDESRCNISDNIEYRCALSTNNTEMVLLTQDKLAINDNSKLYRKIMLGIRLNKGIEISDCEYIKIKKGIKRVAQNHLIIYDNKRIILTAKGRDLADYVINQIFELD